MCGMSVVGLCFFAVWNFLVLALFGEDKLRAMKNRRRISEKVLISCAFLMGALGAFIGMYTFHHKTRKLKFKILIPVALFVNLSVMWILERI